ncbi:toll-like receptor 6 isoform X1 [Ruditapes philippinarum]|uniref:toll-like receptor 6 isoform X1 n=1 Tax=Ruditapes philippinarum TaxID=129788 RepID=UPI00295BAF33|nr:toll-like receptor 6 isoform X1 [Ruditapes philippinarum]
MRRWIKNKRRIKALKDTMKPRNCVYNHFIPLVYLLLETYGLIGIQMDDDCSLENSMVVCENKIPRVVPRKISGIMIRDYLSDTIVNGTFAHASWSSVDFLDITVNQDVGFRLHDYKFFSLKTLSHLGVHAPLYQFNNNTKVFGGLSLLHTLDLSFCRYLDASAIVELLSTVKDLDTLLLDQIATAGDRLFLIDNAFIKAVREKKIHKLSLSGCNLLVKDLSYVPNMSMDLYDLDISNTSVIAQSTFFLNESAIENLFPKIKVLDVSLLQTRFLDFDYGSINNISFDNNCTDTNSFLILILRLENLTLNSILSKPFRANNSFIDLSKCNVNLRSLHVRSNHLHYLNSSILWPEDIYLSDIDMSSNGIEYLSPTFLYSVTSLEILNLSNNELHHMQYFKEFSHLFMNHTILRQLVLSRNRLRFLPFTIFSHNTNLIILDLSYNKLTSISFKLKHLIKLQFLNLRNNDIYYIDGVELNTLKAFVTDFSKHRKIYLGNNPFICNCKSISFIKWLLVYMTNTFNQSLTCSLNDNDVVVIYEAVIKETEFSCIRSKIIIASVSTVASIIIFVSIGIGFMYYKKRKQKRKRQRNNFIEDFKLGNILEKYLCFVSYSSDDNEADVMHVCNLLKESLQELTQTNKEVLCVGNKQFNLGFPIVDEIIRCIKESCVGIFFVTTNSCQSQWCEMELREFYELHKPIILIFKEEIDIGTMSPIMLNVFRQYTRAKINIIDGQIQMTPNLDQLSNSILLLASSHFCKGIL